MPEDSADKRMLKKTLKHLTEVVFPPAKILWELFEDVKVWKDEREKERVQRFLEAYDDLAKFLKEVANGSLGSGFAVSNASGTLTVFPGLENAFSAKMTAVVEAGADIDWDKQPLEKGEVAKLYQKMEESVRNLITIPG